jgi:6-phosphogluconolactonase/glucosamine-6-phosphate isomerase/deaminase
MDHVLMAIEILKQMASGKIFTLESEYMIGMAEDGHIGFIVNGKVNTFSEVSFSQIVRMVADEDIIVIHERKESEQRQNE